MRFLIVVLALFLSSCAVTEERRDWSFIQSVGGIVVGGQDKNPNWLILRGDISGLYEYATKPIRHNSALAVKEINASEHNGVIYIFVTTTTLSEKYNSTKIEGANISGVKAGSYVVQYINENGSVNNIGKVIIHR